MGIFDKFLSAIRVNDDDYDEEEFYDEEDDIEEDSMEEEEAVKPQKKSFFSRIAKKNNDDDLDDFDDEDDLDDEPVKKAEKPVFKRESEPVAAAKPAKTFSSKITPLKRRGNGGMEVSVIKPTSMEDTREIADTLLVGSTVVLNLEGIDVDMAQRVIDFTSGACYAIDGALQKVSSYIFILTPQNVEISGDITDILGGSARADY